MGPLVVLVGDADWVVGSSSYKIVGDRIPRAAKLLSMLHGDDVAGHATLEVGADGDQQPFLHLPANVPRRSCCPRASLPLLLPLHLSPLLMEIWILQGQLSSNLLEWLGWNLSSSVVCLEFPMPLRQPLIGGDYPLLLMMARLWHGKYHVTLCPPLLDVT
jgi:hypothetical protein